MKLIKRNKCSITDERELEHLHTVRNFPIFMGCVSSHESKDIKVDMSWSIGVKFGAVQLNEMIPLEILYGESHGSGDIGTVWDDHHKKFAKFISKYKPTSVFEIGGGHGRLAREYQEYDQIDWTILEPNPTPVENSNAKYIEGFFDSNYEYHDSLDTIVHAHVFEHVYNQDVFMRDLSNFLINGKKLIFALPNMQTMLEKKYTNCLNFEHTVLITEPYIEFILSKYGFSIIEKEYFLEAHSIFYACEKNDQTRKIELKDNLYALNKKLYLDFVTYHEELIEDLNKKVRDSQNPVYLFGAHIFSQYLIAAGLSTEKIKYLLDNDPNKQEKRLYGSSLYVKSPQCLKNIESPLIILKAASYNDEIKKDIYNNINKTCIYLE